MGNVPSSSLVGLDELPSAMPGVFSQKLADKRFTRVFRGGGGGGLPGLKKGITVHRKTRVNATRSGKGQRGIEQRGEGGFLKRGEPFDAW